MSPLYHAMYRSGKLRMAAFFLPLLFISATVLIKVPDDVEAIGDLGIYIELDEGNVDVDVSPGKGGIITFTGSVNVIGIWPDLTSFQYVIVKLQADAGGFKVSEIPELYLVKPSSDEPRIIEAGFTDRPFSISVMIAPGTQYSGMSTPLIVTVGGTWVYNVGALQGEVDAAQMMISVEQYYHYRVECDTSYVQTHPGGEFQLDLKVFNEGNGDDRIEIDIENREKLEGNGWTIQLLRTEFFLSNGGSVKVPIKITTPVKWEPWKNRVTAIRFLIQSSQAASSLEVTEIIHHSVFVRQRGVSIPGFQPALMIFAFLLVSFVYAARRR